MEMNVNFIGRVKQGLIIPDVMNEEIEDVLIVIRTADGSYTVRLTDLQTSLIMSKSKCLITQNQIKARVEI
ncbi:hypothetical protein [Staphylococcus haemolyticus]|uniref:hypothetical protein n=1 Tax=Staphylococcus haemolyticus TaxID=1283 RepID=UPI001F0A60DA|nr:hypothetical protein [Staphylococcus haemolyticus]MCH4501130.1 hypothetical protein [Staphylococcus haemolyticus]